MLRFLGALFIATSALLATVPALAFCRSTTCSGDCERDFDGCKTEGQPLFWASSCVGFSVQRDGSEHIPIANIKTVVQNAFVTWSDIDCGGAFATMAFSQFKDAECHKAEYDPSGPNSNIIMFQDYKWSYTGVDNTLAKTTVSYDTDTGEILDADIELNHAFNEYTVSDDEVVYDMQSILTHEIGHFVGLDHTPDFFATMNAGYSEGSTDQRTIESDDEDAICSAYPPDRNVACDPKPSGGFTRLCSTDDADDGGCSFSPPPPAPTHKSWLLLALIGAGLSQRRRRQGSY